MAIWVIPVIIVGAVTLGLIAGLVVGKTQVKRSKPGYKPLLTPKEKLIYSALFAGGTALILLGAFLKFPEPAAQTDDVMTFEQTGGGFVTGNADLQARIVRGG